jgi:large subunit ribosomal protein L24
MHVKKGDKVLVIAGKDKGVKSTILSASPKTGKVLVEGVAMRKKHIKPKTRDGKGQIISREAFIQASNVQLIDPKTSKPTRTGTKMVGDKKVRIAKKSGQEI